MLVHKIWLTGMPGSGKSTTASLLAFKLGWKHIDLDTYVESKHAHTPISTLIDHYGMPYFRDLESKAIEEMSKLRQVVISTGGGAVLNEENRKIIYAADDTCVFVEVPLEVLAERLSSSSIASRPLLNKPLPVHEVLIKLWNEREEFYKMAPYHVSVLPDDSAEVVTERIINLLQLAPNA